METGIHAVDPLTIKHCLNQLVFMHSRGRKYYMMVTGDWDNEIYVISLYQGNGASG